MFAKPFRVKTQNAIKGSDRKKLRADLAVLHPNIANSQLLELVPHKEEMTVAKIHTNNGETLHVYCLQKNPIFFQVEKMTYPTVYLLWRFPDLLPAFRTWPPVLANLQRGADLMLPGIYVKGDVTPHALGNLQKLTPCSIKMIGNNAPMAVGYTSMSSRDMVYDAGMKGKGVVAVHCYGDYMWKFGDTSEPPTLDDEPVDTDEVDSDGSGHGEDADTPDVPDKNTNAQSECIAPPSNGVITETPLQQEECLQLHEETDDPKYIQDQMDELLEWCFLCAVKMSLKKSDLPILTSNFYRNHILPCCPSGKTLDIKKSSYKKLSKFLCEMAEREIVKLKQDNDVQRITAVDRSHRDVSSVQTNDVHLGAKARAAVTDDEVVASHEIIPPNIMEVYLITTNTLPIFKPLGLEKGCALTAAEVRSLLKEYSQKENLEGPQSCGFVTLDPILAHILLNKGEYVEKLRHDNITTRCLTKMTLAHRMELNGQPSVIRKGHLEPVSITVKTRSGKKKVTFVERLEVYGIDCEELAYAVQKGVSCSTTVTPLPGKHNGMQVMVQGNQTAFITKLLTEKYHLKLKWISGAEKGEKGRKQ